MNLTLVRDKYSPLGIFGRLLALDFSQVAVTLERAYPMEGTSYVKTPPGSYVCVRGIHHHKNGDAYETFEVTHVPDHTSILFHIGNYNQDSEGCILVGTSFDNPDTPTMIAGSRQAFDRFMKLQTGLNTFTLTVKDGIWHP